MHKVTQNKFILNNFMTRTFNTTTFDLETTDHSPFHFRIKYDTYVFYFSEKITPKVKLDLSLQNMTLKKRKESSSPVAMVRKGLRLRDSSTMDKLLV